MAAAWSQKADEMVWRAVAEAVSPIADKEADLDKGKLEKKVREQLRKGAKSLNFTSKQWDEIINEYADACFSGIFATFGDRPWINEVDFILAFDASVKEVFPKPMLARVPKDQFEHVVLAAHDRSYEEHRIMPICWEQVQQVVDGPKMKRKIFNAFEAAWKEAQTPSEEFENEVASLVGQWVDKTVCKLATIAEGDPADLLEPDKAVTVFEQTFANGGMPISLANHPVPEWSYVAETVAQCYEWYGKPAAPVKGKGKGKGKGGGKFSFPY